MLAVKLYFFIFLLYLQKAAAQSPLDTFNITQYLDTCIPFALGLQVEQLSQYQLQKGCQSLVLPYPDLLDLKCCELEYHLKKNTNTNYKGCMSFLSSYIDDDRYEDIIDWIERGKLDKYEYYNIFLGQTVYNMSKVFPLMENETEYEVVKLDCFSQFIFPNNFLIYIFTILILGLI